MLPSDVIVYWKTEKRWRIVCRDNLPPVKDVDSGDKYWTLIKTRTGLMRYVFAIESEGEIEEFSDRTEAIKTIELEMAYDNTILQEGYSYPILEVKNDKGNWIEESFVKTIEDMADICAS